MCSVKSPALKRLLLYHDEVNSQPQKKRVITPNETLFPDVYWQRLSLSLAMANELHELEQPWAWDPTASSRALRFGEGERSQAVVLDGNKEEEQLFGKG